MASALTLRKIKDIMRNSNIDSLDVFKWGCLSIVVLVVAFYGWCFYRYFRELSVRETLSATRSNMRTMATGIESYYVDYGIYPPSSMGNNVITMHPEYRRKGNTVSFSGYQLTTPTNYLDSMVEDHFAKHVPKWFYYYQPSGYDYWILWSAGPDRKHQVDGTQISTLIDDYLTSPMTASMAGGIEASLVPYRYDVTNGTFSPGDVFQSKYVEE